MTVPSPSWDVESVITSSKGASPPSDGADTSRAPSAGSSDEVTDRSSSQGRCPTGTRTADSVLLARCPADQGEELLGYPLADGSWHDITSDEINAYLKEISGAEITAKDFRTWTATVMMAATLAEVPPPTSKTARNKVVRQAYVKVSEQLGNTPAVCKSSYVDPRVVDRFEHGETIADALARAAQAPDDRTAQRTLEAGVCSLLSA